MTNERLEVGERIRRVRLHRQLSLSDVASRAGISTATLSRVETAKQSLDVELLKTLAEVLGVPAAQLLGSADGDSTLESLIDRLSELDLADRARLMRAASQRRPPKDVAAMVEDFMLTLEMIREELEEIGRAARKRRR